MKNKIQITGTMAILKVTGEKKGKMSTSLKKDFLKTSKVIYCDWWVHKHGKVLILLGAGYLEYNLQILRHKEKSEVDEEK